MIESSPPRGKRKRGAVVALGGWAFLWLLFSLGARNPVSIVWCVSGLATCVAGLAVVGGRVRVRRGDSGQAALVAASGAMLGPLAVVLLPLPPVWRALREAPSQWRAEGAELPLERAADQAGTVRTRGSALALGLAATTLSFWSGLFTLAMLVAIVCVALDGADLHWSDGNRVSVAFLYALWSLVAFLFLCGAVTARRGVDVPPAPLGTSS